LSSAREIRRAIMTAPFELDTKGDEVPSPGTLYLPPAHRKALSLDGSLVVGARGVGKSFWTAVLSNDILRQQIGASVTDLAHARIWVGHAAKPDIQHYPDQNTFKFLVDRNYDPEIIWRAVVARRLANIIGKSVPADSWETTVKWIVQNPEPVARLIEEADAKLAENNHFVLLVFDALDRTSHQWAEMDRIVQGLLRLALRLRDFSRLRAKVFLRPDQLQLSTTAFVDASKLMATRADLTWERHDLHAMMWQRLINAPKNNGECMRAVVSSVLIRESAWGDGPVWRLPAQLTSEPPYQRLLFEILAGDKMGKDARRGVPYVWSVSHLADGHGLTSPRSFLAAIRGAAEDSDARYGDYPLAMHYESLKRGIQKASEIRVSEVAEDDPWVSHVMGPLKGKNVPVDYGEIMESWNQKFPDGPNNIRSDRLPPQHAGQGWNGVRDDLVRLGIFTIRSDGRIDMPDLYRVGFGLGRKGGVKPTKTS